MKKVKRNFARKNYQDCWNVLSYNIMGEMWRQWVSFWVFGKEERENWQTSEKKWVICNFVVISTTSTSLVSAWKGDTSIEQILLTIDTCVNIMKMKEIRGSTFKRKGETTASCKTRRGIKVGRDEQSYLLRGCHRTMTSEQQHSIWVSQERMGFKLIS